MQSYSQPDLNEPYISRDDESEAKQVSSVSNLISDEEIRSYALDGFGIDFDNAPVSDNDLSR